MERGLAEPERATTSAFYRPRQARATPLYQFLEAHYQEVKALWEERFEKTFGFWVLIRNARRVPW
jgi:hypothetical protein